MSKSYKMEQRESTVEAVIGDAASAIEDLGSECREASENFPNGDHPKAQAFAEAADVLEGLDGRLDASELHEDARGLKVVYAEMVPRRRSHNPSRSSRCGNAAAMLQAAATALNEWAESRSEQDEGESAAAALAEECESGAGELEGVEFPGMFG